MGVFPGMYAAIVWRFFIRILRLRGGGMELCKYEFYIVNENCKGGWFREMSLKTGELECFQATTSNHTGRVIELCYVRQYFSIYSTIAQNDGAFFGKINTFDETLKGPVVQNVKCKSGWFKGIILL